MSGIARRCWLAAVGNEALAALNRGRPLPTDRLAADLATLDHAGQPNGSATELPLLQPVRFLVAAAAKQDPRAGQSVDAWRMLLISTAYPAGVPPAP